MKEYRMRLDTRDENGDSTVQNVWVDPGERVGIGYARVPHVKRNGGLHVGLPLPGLRSVEAGAELVGYVRGQNLALGTAPGVKRSWTRRLGDGFAAVGSYANGSTRPVGNNVELFGPAPHPIGVRVYDEPGEVVQLQTGRPWTADEFETTHGDVVYVSLRGREGGLRGHVNLRTTARDLTVSEKDLSPHDAGPILDLMGRAFERQANPDSIVWYRDPISVDPRQVHDAKRVFESVVREGRWG